MLNELLFYEIMTYLCTGALVGISAGLLGIGGGLLIVPVLSTAFLVFLPATDVIHLAIGTSLATILVTSFASVRAHHKLHAVRWDIVKLLVAGVLLGSFLGGWSSQFFDSHLLSTLFGLLELTIGIYMILALNTCPHRQLPGVAGNSASGGVIGWLSSLVGIGGGTLTTPYLQWNNVQIHQAIATSAAISLPIALAGTIGYLLAGLNASNLPQYATGYIYWPAFFGIVVASYFTAPIGARWAHRLPVRTLKRFFGIFLIILAIKMLFFVN